MNSLKTIPHIERLLLPLLLLALLVVSTASANPPDAKQRPNIIFIFADDWGWGDLGYRGHAFFKTPHLDKLAQQGTDFQQFTVASGVCSPSRAAVMTGHFPAQHSIHGHFATLEKNAARAMPDWLNPAVVQLPRLLKEAGYATGHFGKWHLTNTDAKDAPLPEAYGYDEAAVFNGPGKQANPANSDVDDMTIDFIKRHKDQPFFINVWLHETHTYHFPKPEYMEQFAHLDEQHQVYAAVLAEGDARVGRIMGALEQQGIADNTLVIFSSDNGPERSKPADTPEAEKMGKDYSYAHEVLTGYGTYASVGSSGGLRSRKRSLYEGGIRVPFIVHWPGHTPAGAVDETTVITAVDLLPTFAEIAGVALPDCYTPDGESMADALRGKPLKRSKPIFWNWRGPKNGDWWPCWVVRDGDWKFLMDEEGKRRELYHIPNNSTESQNLIEEHPDIAMKLEGMLNDWRESIPESPPQDCLSSLR